jgi:putative mRNA 3-end processing factor
MKKPLLRLTDKGLYCPQGDFYIDPWKPVKKAVITHAHGDHARWGSKNYLSQSDSVPILKARLGNYSNFEGIPYFNKIQLNNVKISFHPAGHIIGSAQVRIEYQGEVWVVSGDYKLTDDLVCIPFEPVRCDTFITECTFGLPVYKWPRQNDVFQDIHQWWNSNIERGYSSVVFAYSLGKAQRILNNLDISIGPVYVHGSIFNLNKAMSEAGLPVKEFPKVDLINKKADYKKALIIAPPSAERSNWMKRFQPFSTGVASGWMAIKGIKRRHAVDKGFILSDHADWEELNLAVNATGAENIFTTHGYTTQFAMWLQEKGLNTGIIPTKFEGEVDMESEKTEETSLPGQHNVGEET